MKILAIDPGPEESGLVLMHDGAIVEAMVAPNQFVLGYVIGASREPGPRAEVLAVEMIASYGMAVGAEVFDTCVWIGRFIQAWRGREPQLVFRKDVKQHLCGTDKAKDPNVRQRLIDLIGKPGTKKNPGPTFGVTSHAWAALAVAAMVEELR